jgi:ketosteroid isomerase-like protein
LTCWRATGGSTIKLLQSQLLHLSTEEAMIWKSHTRLCALAAGLILIAAAAGVRAQQPPESNAVSAANHAFDKALSARDIVAMERVWATEPHVIAIHPASKALIVGWDAVRKSWEGTFDRFAEISVSMKDPQIRITQNVAWVVGVEMVQGKSRNGDAVSFAAFTTNMYEKRDGRWLMVLHTTSRVPQ